MYCSFYFPLNTTLAIYLHTYHACMIHYIQVPGYSVLRMHGKYASVQREVKTAVKLLCTSKYTVRVFYHAYISPLKYGHHFVVPGVSNSKALLAAAPLWFPCAFVLYFHSPFGMCFRRRYWIVVNIGVVLVGLDTLS